MKKKLYAVISAICIFAMLFSFIGCTENKESDETVGVTYHTVKFNTGYTPITELKVAHGTILEEPELPRQESMIFRRWECEGRPWAFHLQKVTEDITLDAVWLRAEDLFLYDSIEGLEGIAISSIRHQKEFHRLVVPDIINGMTVIGVTNGAFASITAEHAEHITFPESVTYIGSEAFIGISECELEFEGVITYIGESAFENCRTLTGIALGKGLSSVPFRAFYGCTALSKIDIPDGVTSVAENAFEGCTSLLTAVLPATLKSIENSAFKECDSLKTVFFGGTAEAFAALSIADGNDAIKDAAVCFYSEEKPTDTQAKYWHYDSNGKAIIW